jgi:transmembrane sensor
MSGRGPRQKDGTGEDGARAAAAAWVVRLQAPEAGEAEWLEFEAWLTATPRARAAYDDAMALWLLADLHQDDAATAPTRRRSRRAPPWAALGGAGLAAGLASVLAVVMLVRAPSPPVRPSVAPAATVYATASGERRTVMLADGSRLDLSGGTQVSVTLGAHARRATLSAGEVAFTVVHDPARPFAVAVGDREVRDLGTEFDIRREGDQIRVTVRRGRVEVAANDGGRGAPIALGAGRQLTHDEGTAVSTVSRVSADEVFAWKQGRLIYRDQPLRMVVDDLNRYFPHAVRIEGERVAELRFTGVLTVDGEDATIRRLVGLLPISATRINGATVLKAREDAR